MQLRTSILIVAATAALAFAQGCSPDTGKQDPGMSARSSSNVPPANAPGVAPVSTPAASPTDVRPVIVCFGDSITAGYGLDFASAYPADLQRLLDNSAFRYRVVNRGISGETTKDGLARVPSILALHPSVVVVEFGGNDGLRGLPIAETQASLLAMVRALQHGGTQVLVAGISLPPQFGEDYVSHFSAMFPAVARQAGAPIIPFIYKGVYGVDGMIQDDGVHPTIAGSDIVAKNIAGALTPLLEKSRR